MFIDTHAHLYSDQFAEDINAVVQRAKNLNVHKIFLPNIDSSSTSSMLELATKFPETCFPMIGLHPCSVKEHNYKDEMEHIVKMLEETKFYGIGETGIDLYWDKSTFEIQKEAFQFQIDLAKANNLPIIIHSRDSLDHTIKMISDNQDGRLKGIFHCFNGTVEQCKEISDLNFMMGLGGVITYKNAGLDEMVLQMPINKMVLETDAPYLSPVPHRGKRNESSYIPLVAAKVSEIRNESLREIMLKTTNNALDLFGIEQ